MGHNNGNIEFYNSAELLAGGVNCHGFIDCGYLFVRGFIQRHDLERLQKREAVLLKIKDKKDTQEYYNKVLLSSIREHEHRGLL